MVRCDLKSPWVWRCLRLFDDWIGLLKWREGPSSGVSVLWWRDGPFRGLQGPFGGWKRALEKRMGPPLKSCPLLTKILCARLCTLWPAPRWRTWICFGEGFDNGGRKGETAEPCLPNMYVGTLSKVGGKIYFNSFLSMQRHRADVKFRESWRSYPFCPPLTFTDMPRKAHT